MTALRSRALSLECCRRCSWAMTSLSRGAQVTQDAHGRRFCSGDAGRNSHAVVRSTANGKPGGSFDRGKHPRDPLVVADGVLRQRSTPAGYPGVDRVLRRARCLSELLGDDGHQFLVMTLQIFLLAVPAHRE